jgi:hypothetical protein|uniref:Uncharacterized protein n=2 Tax=Picea TaxID=3328 RepID=A0A124GN02_PICGL|nr:hypothetical protein ABT39_MTgene5486 [Picea glauca]QHR91550.1 hypothetical protein Q903MT_gene5585 [Picea sitchensis]
MGLQIRARIIRNSALILGAIIVVPPKNSPQGVIRIEVPMQRVLPRRYTVSLLRTHHDAYEITLHQIIE